QGNGNDFVIIDNRQDFFDKNNTTLIAHLCDRRLGIGADGLILLENHSDLDFKMVYFNADGNESSMCGNGGRCITDLASYIGIIDKKATFEAIDGIHHAVFEGGLIKLQMQDVIQIQRFENDLFLDTGSPHYVTCKSDIEQLDVKQEGAKIRYNQTYKEDGVNVNFVEKVNDETFSVRTYERGVENETLSCGTGVTAVALAMHYIGETEKNLITLKTQGGKLKVSFDKKGDSYINIWLIGSATQVYKGEMKW
ncbi:diaminopimelate epimerase, partial [Flavobacteriaceae bacterium AH-315-B10]|nr:diaminopimelate epimerase [Flavobacteriaceae bacterium AH-315-B10]